MSNDTFRGQKEIALGNCNFEQVRLPKTSYFAWPLWRHVSTGRQTAFVRTSSLRDWILGRGAHFVQASHCLGQEARRKKTFNKSLPCRFGMEDAEDCLGSFVASRRRWGWSEPTGTQRSPTKTPATPSLEHSGGQSTAWKILQPMSLWDAARTATVTTGHVPSQVCP